MSETYSTNYRLQHPCAETCSGYKQVAEEATQAQSQEIARLRERVGKLREAVKWYATPGIHERWRAEEALSEDDRAAGEG